MPMQRYEGGATPFQQVDPTAAKASAQMFNSLSQRLESWQNTLYDVGKVEAAENGRQQAINDLASGQPARIEKGYSFYDRAYNDVSKAAYNVEVESKLKQQAEALSAKYSLDPQGFQEVFGGSLNGTVNAIQEPEFKVLAMQAGQKLLGTYTANIANEAFKVQRENDEKAINAGIKEIGNQYESSYANADEIGMNESLAKISTLYQRKIDAGLMNPELVAIEMKELGKRAVKTKIYKDHSNALAQGDTTHFTSFLSSDTYKAMNVDDQNEVRKKMQDQIDDNHKAMLAEFKNNNEMVAAVSKKTFEDAQSQVITSRKFLTDSEINDMVKANKLTSDDSTKLKQFQEDLRFGSITDDPADEMYITRNLGHIPDAHIQSANLTTNKKIELMGKNRAAKEHYDWLQAQNDLLKAFRNINGMSPHQMMNQELDVAFPVTNPSEKPAMEAKKWNLNKEILTEVQNKGLPVTAIPQVAKQVIEREKEKEATIKKLKVQREESEKSRKAYIEYLDSTSIYYDKALNGRIKTQEEVYQEIKEKEKKYGGK